MKRVLCLLLVLLLTAAFTACTGDPSANTSDNASDTASDNTPANESGKEPESTPANESGNGSETQPENSEASEAAQTGSGDNNGNKEPSGALKAVADAKVGDLITFGSWDQDGKEGGEPISWIVLAQGVGKTFVLSEKILEYQCFQNGTEEEKYPKALYKDSDLRAYLNGEFYEGAFSADEKAAILTSKITSQYKDEQFFEHTYETEDKVFPLSREEAARYVCGVGTNVFGIPTARVLEENPYMMSSISGVAGVSKAASWWLRDMGTESSKKAAYVYATETQRKNYDTAVYEKAGVRPAMWIVYDGKELESYEKGETGPKADKALDDTIAKLKVGAKFQFGKYDKNPYNMDGYEDLVWTVISEDDTSFLLISDDQVGNSKFVEKTAEGFNPEDASWAESVIRPYLNSDGFLDFMFSPQEKAKLVLSHVVSSGEDDRDGGKATDDYIFIPDVKDIEGSVASAGISYKYWLRSQLSWKPYMGMVYGNGSVGSMNPTETCYLRIMTRISK